MVSKKSKTIYVYRSGFSNKLDAQIAGEELERIRKRDGILKTSIVLKEAEPETATLHSAFEWDDSVAADNYRKNQVRSLIRCVQIANPDYIDSPMASAFVHVSIPNEREGYYQSPNIVVKNVDEFEIAMSEAIARVNSAKTAVHELEAVANQSKFKDKLAMVITACQALDTASDALQQAVH